MPVESRKIIWRDAMHIGPEHFRMRQQTFANTLLARETALSRHSYGLLPDPAWPAAGPADSGFLLSHSALLNRKVRLIRARGILPGGLPFHIPDTHATPTALDISGVRLAHAAYVNVYLHAGPAPDHETRAVRDFNSGDGERDVEVGSPALVLSVGQEPPAAGAMAIARLRRSGAGSLYYDPDFVPPSLQITCSRSLVRLVQPLAEELIRKVDRVRKNSSETLGSPAGPVAAEWFVQTVAPAVANLRDAAASRVHPERLYLLVSRVAGILCTFIPGTTAAAIPAYNHDDVFASLSAMDKQIRAHLNAIAPTPVDSIPLALTEEGIFAGENLDLRYFAQATWVLGVGSDVADASLVETVLNRFRISSLPRFTALRHHGAAGLTLSHRSIPPGAIATRPFFEYFVIDSKAASARVDWEDMRQSRSVAVYVPPDVAEPRLELQVILPEGS